MYRVRGIVEQEGVAAGATATSISSEAYGTSSCDHVRGYARGISEAEAACLANEAAALLATGDLTKDELPYALVLADFASPRAPALMNIGMTSMCA
jgi:hypothetical protein